MEQSKLNYNEEASPFKGKGSVTKQEICEAYNISLTTLGGLLNKQYYSILKELGYKKRSNILSPKIINTFIELYGEPL